MARGKRDATNTTQEAKGSEDAASATQQQATENTSLAEKEEEETDYGEVRGWSPAKGKSRKSKFICKGGLKVCGLSISSNEDSVSCDACGDWYHPKCQGLTAEAFKALTKFESDFLWLCTDCKPQFRATLEVSKSLVGRIEQAEKRIIDSFKEAQSKELIGEQLQDKICRLEKTVKDMKDQQASIERVVAEQKEAVKDVPKYTEQLKNSTREMKKIVDSHGKEGREYNIILHNIPESDSEDAENRKQHDLKMFNNVVSALLGTEMKVETNQVYRLGKRQAGTTERADNVKKSRLLLLKLKEKEHVNELMKRRTKLREVGFSNVYLTKNLSPEEREEERALREELEKKGKATHVIFRGKVVPRK